MEASVATLGFVSLQEMDLFGRGSIFLSSISIIDRWQRSGCRSRAPQQVAAALKVSHKSQSWIRFLPTLYGSHLRAVLCSNQPANYCRSFGKMRQLPGNILDLSRLPAMLAMLKRRERDGARKVSVLIIWLNLCWRLGSPSDGRKTHIGASLPPGLSHTYQSVWTQACVHNTCMCNCTML